MVQNKTSSRQKMAPDSETGSWNQPNRLNQTSRMSQNGINELAFHHKVVSVKSTRRAFLEFTAPRPGPRPLAHPYLALLVLEHSIQ